MNDATQTPLSAAAEATLVALKAHSTLLKAREAFAYWETQVEITRGELALAAPDDREAKDQAEGAGIGLDFAREKLALAEAGERLAEKRSAEAKAAGEAERLAAVRVEAEEHSRRGAVLVRAVLDKLDSLAGISSVNADFESWQAAAQQLRTRGGWTLRLTPPSRSARAWNQLLLSLSELRQEYETALAMLETYGYKATQEQEPSDEGDPDVSDD